jgi:hypothetical protein
MRPPELALRFGSMAGDVADRDPLAHDEPARTRQRATIGARDVPPLLEEP